jgi:hypothetical protein
MRDDLIDQWIIDSNEPVNRVIDDLPKWHILFGFVISYILIYFFNFSLVAGIIIFISSFLIIDSDHFLLYILRKKDFNFFRFYKLSKENEGIVRDKDFPEYFSVRTNKFVYSCKILFKE